MASTDGFLFDSGSWEGRFGAARAKELHELSEEPCLILLGEPGLGKSYAVKQAVEDLRASLNAESDEVELVDLRRYGEASLLPAKLTEGQRWRAWQEGDRTLHLFLDSLDEAFSRRYAVREQLVGELAEAADDFSRLRLRIVCRSAEWVNELGEDLHDLLAPAFPHRPKLPRQMTLMQLRKEDARLAVRAEGLDPDTFLAEISDRSLEGMASIPLTLEMLIETAKEPGGLPDTRVELFERAARRLAREHHHERRRNHSGHGHHLDAHQRLAVAERIAACAIFSGQTTIAVESHEVPSGVLDPVGISGRTEEVPGAGEGTAFKVNRDEIGETLLTGLFLDVGPNRVRFRHRSVAEFLAASYIARHSLDRAQLISLFAAPDDEEGRLIPQLRETAGWAAAIYPEALTAVLEREPEVALRADRPPLSPEQATRVVSVLLDEDVAEAAGPWIRRLERNLSAVDHSGLAGELRPSLRDKQASSAVRAMALRIVRACETRDLEPELVELALDRGEPATLRALAIRGLERFGSEGGRASLVPLALRSLSEDEDETEEVRGAALDATYTHCLEIEETLASLTEPRVHEGGYMHFLRWTLPAGITADDLPVALRWATEVEPLATHESGLNSVVDAILERAWPRVRDPEIGERLASVVHERLRRRIAPFGREHAADVASPFRDADRRRTLLRYLVNWATDPLETTGELRPDLLADAEPPLLCDEDRAWLLDRVEETIGGPAEIRWISLILWVAYMEEPELERLFGLFERSELLRQWIAPTYEDIPIARGLARVGRERFEKEFPELALARPSGRDQEIRTALAASERGDLDAWRRLNESMRFGPEDRDEDVDEREADLIRTPGWKRADAATRERILIAARSFIERADPGEDESPDPQSSTEQSPDPQSPTEESFDPQSVFVTGCRALLLLAARAPSSLKELGESTWGRWAPIIFDLGIETFSPEEEAVAQWLFVAAAEGAPVEVAGWATAIVERRVKAGADHLGLVGRLERVHNQPLTDALLAKLTEPMRPGVLGELLTWAIAREPQRAAELVRPRLAPDAIADSADSRASARAVAKVLLEDLPSVGWPVVRGFLETDRALGIEVLREATAWGPIETGDLDDVQLAELVTVVLDLSPFDIEPGGLNGDNAEAPERAEALTPPGYRLEAIRSTQAQLLGALSERGSAEAVAAVEDLHRRFPDHVPRAVLRAVKEARRSQSRALGPRQVLLLCSSNTARVVFSDRGLQEAVMASLGRIQRRLREGRSPAAPELWSGKQPRKEEELSDWLARELERDLSTGGKFVGREVQVKPNPTGRGRGSSTDILVSAPIGELVDGSETVTVVLEVKGCWEPKVKTRMKDQLVEDYLASLGTRCGIYVVFWFPLDEWTPEDSNRGRGVSGMESASVRELFKAQAEELGEGDDLSIESFVFDCTLRRPGQTASSSRRAAISGQEDRRDQGATTRRETGGGDAER